MNKNCLLCGVGGQGTVLASRLIAAAAMEKGMNARTAETIGMAQRGGSVVSHVRIGEEICSSMIPKGKADILIGFEPGEAVRTLSYLKRNGVVIVNRKAVAPVTASLSATQYNGEEMITYLEANVKRVVVVDGDEICKICGSDKVLNIALLGAAIATGELGITTEEMKQAIKDRVKPAFYEMNLQALEEGERRVKTWQNAKN